MAGTALRSDHGLETSGFTTEAASDYADDLSIGLLLTLERLTPLERTSFLLHDVFDVDFREVAKLIGRTETASRQLAARAASGARKPSTVECHCSR